MSHVTLQSCLSQKHHDQSYSFINIYIYAFFRLFKLQQKWYDKTIYLANFYQNFEMGAFIIFYKKIPFKCMATFSAKGSITGRSNVRTYLAKLNDFTKRYPLSRGMIAYSLTWPISNLCQQSIRGSKEWDFAEALRFCLYGSCFVAPTLHGWLRLAANMWPQLNFRSAIAKVSHTILGLCL
jgi:hypothetical protein